MEKVFEAMNDEYLERRSPLSMEKRRKKRAMRGDGPERTGLRKQGAEGRAAANPALEKPRAEKPGPKTTTDTNTRRIPAHVRDAVYQRDGGRCTYVGTAGERCGATRHLQIDHIVPRGRGGTNTTGNLRLLCGKHNRLEAERIYGANAIRRYGPMESWKVAGSASRRGTTLGLWPFPSSGPSGRA